MIGAFYLLVSILLAAASFSLGVFHTFVGPEQMLQAIKIGMLGFSIFWLPLALLVLVVYLVIPRFKLYVSRLPASKRAAGTIALMVIAYGLGYLFVAQNPIDI